MSTRPLSRVVVCSACRRASCWHGVFVCPKPSSKALSIAYADAQEESREHPFHWTREATELNAPTTRDAGVAWRMAAIHGVPMTVKS